MQLVNNRSRVWAAGSKFKKSCLYGVLAPSSLSLVIRVSFYLRRAGTSLLRDVFPAFRETEESQSVLLALVFFFFNVFLFTYLLFIFLITQMNLSHL